MCPARLRSYTDDELRIQVLLFDEIEYFRRVDPGWIVSNDQKMLAVFIKRRIADTACLQHGIFHTVPVLRIQIFSDVNNDIDFAGTAGTWCIIHGALLVFLVLLPRRELQLPCHQNLSQEYNGLAFHWGMSAAQLSLSGDTGPGGSPKQLDRL
jgi:hypothetical protein